MFHTGILNIMDSQKHRQTHICAQVMQNKYGLRVVKYLVAGREAAYTYPDVLEIMKVLSNHCLTCFLLMICSERGRE